MLNKQLAGLMLAIPIILVGAGCVPQKSTNENAATNTAPTVATGTENSDELGISAEVQDGSAIVKVVGQETKRAATPSYLAALELYDKAALRVQIIDCSGKPGNLTVKKGTKFMLDNRDESAHKIVIGPKSYNLAPYNFAVVSVTKVGVYNITCDGGGAASITVVN